MALQILKLGRGANIRPPPGVKVLSLGVHKPSA